MSELVKSPYGLKQAPKPWYKKLDQTIMASGFKNDGSDKCVHIVIVCLYIGDMLIINRDTSDKCY